MPKTVKRKTYRRIPKRRVKKTGKYKRMFRGGKKCGGMCGGAFKPMFGDAFHDALVNARKTGPKNLIKGSGWFSHMKKSSGGKKPSLNLPSPNLLANFRPFG
jgi:hypothetical protein